MLSREKTLAPDPADVAPSEWFFLLVLGVLGSLFYLAPWPLVYCSALAGVGFLAWFRLDLSLLLVPLFAPFFMEPKHLGLHLHLGGRQIGVQTLAPSEVLLLVDAGVALALLLFRRPGVLSEWRIVRRSPFLLPALLFLVAGTLSTVAAVERHQALEWYRWSLLEPTVFFVLILLLERRPSSRMLMLVAVVASGMAVGVMALGQAILHRDLSSVPGSTLRRVKGPYGSPDNLGLLYDRVIPVWFAFALLARRRILWWPIAVLLLPALVLTFSRGAWIAVMVGCLLILILAVPWGRWVALLFLVVAATVTVFAGPRAVQALRSGHSHTVERRLDIWSSSIQMIRDHPVLGVGPDNFIHYYAPRHQLYIRCSHGLGYMRPRASDEPCLSHPHNEVLDVWLTAGILGFVAFVWLQVVFWRTALDSWFRLRSGYFAPLVLGSMGAMVAALAHGMVDHSYFLPDLAFIFWLLCACVSGAEYE